MKRNACYKSPAAEEPMARNYEISTVEGRTIELSAAQTERYDAGDVDVIEEIAEGLPAGYYSLYAADSGPLLENIWRCCA
jgi:hypothetical protein